MEEKQQKTPYSEGVKKNSTFMINPELERDAKDYALINRISYSALVEQCVLEKVLPYRDSIKEFFKHELKPSLPVLPDVPKTAKKSAKKK